MHGSDLCLSLICLTGTMLSKTVKNKRLKQFPAMFTSSLNRAATIRFDASKIDYRPFDAIFDS